MNFDRMRALLLEQAIRGKLVPQLDSEEAVNQIGEVPENVPFVIPNKWKWIYLKHLVSVISGTSYKKSDQVSDENGVRIIRGGNLRNFKVEIRSDDVFVVSNLADSDREVQKEDIVIVASTGSKEVIGRAAVYTGDEKIQIGAFLRLIRPKFEGYSEYLKVIFQSDYYREHIRNSVKGTNINNVKKEYITELCVPIPPVAEQIRIVAKLDEAFAEIDRAEKAYRELQTLSGVLRGQILQEAIQGKLVPQLDSEAEVQQIGDSPEEVPFAIPEKWKWINLKLISKALSDGSHNPPPNAGQGIPVLSAKNVFDGQVHAETANRWATEEDWKLEDKKVHIEKGDVLLTIVGTIGRTAVVGDIERFMLQRSVCVIKPQGEILDSHYLSLMLNAPAMLEWMMDRAAGTAQKGVYLRTLKDMPFPVPPVQEQVRIVTKVKELLRQVKALSGR